MVRSSSLLGLGALLASRVAADYSLVDTYDRSNFFNSFDFFSGGDPTHGFVKYAAAQQANSAGLAGYSENMVYLGVDHQTQDPALPGRGSVRLSSKKTYTKGLFVADIQHMPVGCGVWPAFWTFGPNWPSSGEIDILEGVNSQTTNAVTLHTSEGCSMSNSGGLSTTKFSDNNSDCGAGGGNMGCSQQTVDTSNFGSGFNAQNGGIYAMEWTSDSISVWLFARNSAQAQALTNASNGTAPDPKSFGTPMATFNGGGCDIDNHFKDHQIVFNIALCGDWAGQQQVWQSDATCGKLANTCQDYVSQNAGAFTDAYFLINSLKVYQQGAGNQRRDLKVRKFIA